MPLKYMLFQAAARKNAINGSNSVQLLPFNPLYQNLNIPKT